MPSTTLKTSDSTSIVPYRSPSPIEKYEEEVRQKSGLIKSPVPNPWTAPARLFVFIWKTFASFYKSYLAEREEDKKNCCRPPEKYTRIYHWIKGSPIAVKTLYRCDKCLKVYELVNQYHHMSSSYRLEWIKIENEREAKRKWREKGGEL